VINPDRSVYVYTDPSVGPFDGIEDTLVGIQNNSSQPVPAIVAYGPSGLFSFDGDGVCNASGSPAGCPFGSTGYEGPGISFITDPTSQADGELDFAGAGLVAGSPTYFSLEGAVTSATLKVSVGHLSSCNQAGQMVSNTPLQYDKWQLQYGISQCEGLVVSNVSLNSRLFAERASLPYLDLQTCTGQGGGIPSNVSGCGTSTFRHITLQPSTDEAQQDLSAYTHVQLVSSGVSGGAAASYAPCNSRSPCEHVAIKATYRISLSPPTGTNSDQYLLVTQTYEFYRDFRESDFPDLACEPSQGAPYGISVVASPLPDCGRWKPLVTYKYEMGQSKQILVALNAAERLHYTPDAVAVRASTFARDCDTGTPQANCFAGQLELYHSPLTGNEENPIQHEAVIRAVQATDSGNVANMPGRFDNVHATPSAAVGSPVPVPPGCEECAHMHWRWGADVSGHAATAGEHQFGDGNPLLGDSEPGGSYAPTSRQQLDVALVAYHSEELSPRNFFDLVQGANPSALDMHNSTSDVFSGGRAQGTETLNYRSGECYAAYALDSWGQCGQVVWLSATAYGLNVSPAGVGDEDSDTFFAFGGFFCGHCSAPNYSDFLGFKPSYSPAQITRMKPGQPFRISFGQLPKTLPPGVNIQLFDILPSGMTNVHVTINQVQSIHNAISCSTSTLSSGLTLVGCDIQEPSSANGPPSPCTNGPCIQIEGDLSQTPGGYQNVVHLVWTNPSFGNNYAGNLKQVDPVNVVLH
jgi:hypothetical protein